MPPGLGPWYCPRAQERQLEVRSAPRNFVGLGRGTRRGGRLWRSTNCSTLTQQRPGMLPQRCHGSSMPTRSGCSPGVIAASKISSRRGEDAGARPWRRPSEDLFVPSLINVLYVHRRATVNFIGVDSVRGKVLLYLQKRFTPKDCPPSRGSHLPIPKEC